MTFLEDENFFGSLRNCEWLKLLGCDREFYQWTHNLVGGEEFSWQSLRFFSVLREFVQMKIFGLIENDFCLEKVIFLDEGFGVPEEFFCFTEDFDAAVSNFPGIKDFSWELKIFLRS